MAGTERQDERAATRQWIGPGDSRYKELIADMWNDLRVRNLLVAGVDALTRIETHLTAKSRGGVSGSLQLQALVLVGYSKAYVGTIREQRRSLHSPLDQR